MKGILRQIFLLSMVLGLFPLAARATEFGNYEITFKVKGLNAGDTCMVAYYLGTKQYIDDTIVAGAGGVVNYKGNKKVDQGLYLFVMPGMTYFEFLFVEPKFSLETSKEDPVLNMKTKGSPENEAFYNYLRYLQTKQKEVKDLQTAIAAEKDSVKIKALNAKVMDVDKDVKAFRDQQVAEHKGKFFSKLVYASAEPEVPAAPANLTAEAARTWQLAKFRVAYLDQVDWTDSRLLRTPVIQNRIKDYLEKFTVDHPDSIIVGAEAIMRRAEQDKDIFKFAVITITNMYAGSKKMCFDKIYVHMAGNYYVSGRAEWVDSTQMAKIKDRYYRMLYNDCDRKAVNLRMKTLKDESVDLYSVNAKFTVVVFWAYDCGHCKKEIPQLYEFYKEYKEKGVEVFAVSTKEDVPKWKEFVDEKGLHDWINVADLDNKTQFRIFYDVYSTPVIYLLDENKNIIGKRLDVDNLKRIIHFKLGLPEPETVKE
jgi:thiol-disulfide isomerase/thioredoxin